MTLNGEAQTVKTNLNQVTVLDARGGNLGWSLTGSMTDLVAANGTDKIPAGNLSWTPSCAAGTGSLSTVTNGTAGRSAPPRRRCAAWPRTARRPVASSPATRKSRSPHRSSPLRVPTRGRSR
ncbi:hypothetical protein ACU686_06100 [Yinghuangia aomiensis]